MSDDVLGHPEMRMAFTRASDRLDRVFNDAKRWAYVRDNLAHIHSLKMNNQHYWRLGSLRGMTGATIDEAIDKLIAESK